MNYCVTVFGCKKYEDVAHVFVKGAYLLNNDLFSRGIFFSDEFIPDLAMDQIVINENLSWSSRLAKSLATIDKDYIFFFLDDYFLLNKVDTLHLEKIVNWSKELGVKYCRLINNPLIPNFGDMKPLPVVPYSINLQPALWERKFLISVLNKIDSNPWSTETSLHKFFKVNNNFYDDAVGFNLIDEYLNAVIKGKWSRNVPENMIRDSKRLKMSRQEWTFYKVKSKLSASLNPYSKSIVKKILKKIGFTFYS